ncbi:MAG: helix-hairpin-helix domain-containing protein [Pseudomonadales bacterium]
MKARNLLASFVAVIVLCWSNVLFADDVGEIDMAMITVNINQADAATLASVLSGVGLSRAEAIVAYRENNGKFYSAEELSSVGGIGPSTIAKNEGRIVVK